MSVWSYIPWKFWVHNRISGSSRSQGQSVRTSIGSSFQRRVIERLATGIQQICDTANTENIEALTQEFRTGFNANAHERFAALVRNTAYSGMAFTFSFSPEWPVPSRLNQTSEFSVGPKHVEIAQAAAQVLRGKDPDVPRQVSGPVVRLQNESDPSDLTPATEEGEISVLYDSPRLRPNTRQDHAHAGRISQSGRCAPTRSFHYAEWLADPQRPLLVPAATDDDSDWWTKWPWVIETRHGKQKAKTAL